MDLSGPAGYQKAGFCHTLHHWTLHCSSSYCHRTFIAKDNVCIQTYITKINERAGIKLSKSTILPYTKGVKLTLHPRLDLDHRASLQAGFSLGHKGC